MNTNELNEIIENLKQKARDSWAGQTGEDRATILEEFLIKLLADYSRNLGLSKLEIMKAIESKRTYSALNYYQAANFPMLEDVVVFKDQDEMMSKLRVKEGFRCPACEGISKNPYTCDTGIKKHGKICDWKSYGLFGTMGKGFRFTIVDGFLDKPVVDECFMPIAIEKDEASKELA